jgi:hypothetical protein
VTAAAVAAYFGVFVTRSERRLKADARYQRINKQLESLFLHGQRAPLVIELFDVARDEKLRVAGADAAATSDEAHAPPPRNKSRPRTSDSIFRSAIERLFIQKPQSG